MGVQVTQPGAQKWQEVAVLRKRVPGAACAAGSERRSPDEGDMLRGSAVSSVYPTDTRDTCSASGLRVKDGFLN